MDDGAQAPNLDLAGLRDRAGKIARGMASRRELWRDEPIYRALLRSRVTNLYYRRRFAEFGDNSVLDRPIWLYGPQHMAFGKNVIILRGSWLAVERPAWANPEPTLRVGNRFAARPFVTISAANSIVIEDNVGIASFATVIDNDHTWSSGRSHVLDSPIKSAPIHIGEGTFISERAAVLAGSQIGRQCFIGANTVVKSTIPDYSIVLGVPGRVVGSTKDD